MSGYTFFSGFLGVAVGLVAPVIQASTVAVLDPGAFYPHSSFEGRILLNEKDLPGNALDEDDNGFVDDFLGWDFLRREALTLGADAYSNEESLATAVASRVLLSSPRARILPVRLGLLWHDFLNIVIIDRMVHQDRNDIRDFIKDHSSRYQHDRQNQT